MKWAEFPEALEAARTADNVERRKIARALARPDRPTIEGATRALESDDPFERGMAVQVLGELFGLGGEPYLSNAGHLLNALLSRERDAGVLTVAVDALGRRRYSVAFSNLINMAASDSASVREAVARALPEYVECDYDTTVNALISLSEDATDSVRDWSTCSLGTQLLDTEMSERATRDPNIHRALLQRRGDEHVDTRAEAVFGLASRGDRVVTEDIRQALEARSVGRLSVAAAEKLGDHRLFAPLTRLRERWDVDLDLLERAIARCSEGSAESGSTA